MLRWLSRELSPAVVGSRTVVGVERFDVGFRDSHNGNGFAKSVEDLQDAPTFTVSRVWDSVHKACDVAATKGMFAEITSVCHPTLVNPFGLRWTQRVHRTALDRGPAALVFERRTVPRKRFHRHPNHRCDAGLLRRRRRTGFHRQARRCQRRFLGEHFRFGRFGIESSTQWLRTGDHA